MLKDRSHSGHAIEIPKTKGAQWKKDITRSGGAPFPEEFFFGAFIAVFCPQDQLFDALVRRSEPKLGGDDLGELLETKNELRQWFGKR